MEISKELKEKLLKANSPEEMKALLGEAVTDEQAAQMWLEAQALRGALDEMDDGELDAVNGGIRFTDIFTRPFAPPDRDYNTQGCAATVEYGSRCGSNDACYSYDVKYDHIENACVYGVKGHDWEIEYEPASYGREGNEKVCRRCGKRVKC